MEQEFALSPSQLQAKIALLANKMETEGLSKEEKYELKELKSLLNGEYMPDYLEY